jgi:NitT/TauT family transport system substrate-binding protein
MRKVSSRTVALRALFGALVLVAVLVAQGCGGSDSTAGSGGDEPAKVTLALSTFQDFYAVHVGIEKGFFADRGIEIAIKQTDYPGANALLVGNKVDLAATCEADVITQNAVGQDTTLAFPMFFFSGAALTYDAKKHPEWKTFATLLESAGGDQKAALKAVAEQIKDAKVAQYPGDTTFAAMLRVAGLDPDEFKTVDLPQEDMVPALISGSVDIIIGGIPQRLAAQREGFSELASQDILPTTVLHCGYAAHRSWVDGNHDLALRFQSALYETLAYTEENQEDAFGIIAASMEKAGTKINEADLPKIWNAMEFFPASPANYLELTGEGGKFDWQLRFNSVISELEKQKKIEKLETPLADLNYGEQLARELESDK